MDHGPRVKRRSCRKRIHCHKTMMKTNSYENMKVLSGERPILDGEGKGAASATSVDHFHGSLQIMLQGLLHIVVKNSFGLRLEREVGPCAWLGAHTRLKELYKSLLKADLET